MGNRRNRRNNNDVPTTQDNENLPKDYYEWIRKNYKKIIKLFISALPFFSVVIAFFIYIYTKGKYDYFMINDDWINPSIAESIYNGIYSCSIGMFVLLPNLISLTYYLFEKNIEKRVKFETKFILISVIIILVLSFTVSKITNFYFGETVKLLSALWLMCFATPIYVAWIYVISEGIGIFFYKGNKGKRWNYIRGHFKFNKLKHPIKSIVSVRQKISDFSFNVSPDMSESERITNKNKGVVILVIVTAVLFSGLVLYVKRFGKIVSMTQKKFSIINLAESEYYDELKGIESLPYITENKQREINTKAILAENDKHYLIINAYLDRNEKDKTLYLFTDEQTIIEKKNISYEIIELEKPPKLSNQTKESNLTQKQK